MDAMDGSAGEELAANASRAADLDRWNGDPSFMLSLARGLLVLDAVAAGRDAPSNRELCAQTGLSRAALRRCLYTLESLGYVESAEGGVRPGPRLGSLATSYVSSNPLLSAYRPAIRALSDRTGQSVSFGIYEHGLPRPVGIAHCDNPVQLGVTSRDRIPIHCSSIGRVMLAAMPEGEALERLRSEARTRDTEHTRTSIEEIMTKVAEARRLGYAIVDREAQLSLRAVAAGVCNSRGETVGWMNITVHASMMTLKELRTRIAPEVKRSAEALSKQIP
jgi:IclR family pca regulon transcriptional regulator